MSEGIRANRPDPQDVFSVSELTELIKETLTSVIPAVWVRGELSDVVRPRSGHVYFALKDQGAQIRGIVWRTTAQRIRFQLESGQEVVCLGRLDVYAPRGSYQLIVQDLHPLGEGALQLALRQLQRRLEAEGLFDARHKKPLPRFPRRVAFVTSPTGAAVRDFLEVLRRRWRSVEVVVVPVRVQGDGAAAEIARGIRMANRMRPAPDVVVVGRGGGSPEDLWCFNEEPVVRAVFASALPIVSAVGHEIDVSLSDLAADVRALTPSEAAERIVPSEVEVRETLESLRQRLARSLRTRATDARARLDALLRRPALRRPRDLVLDAARRVDELQLRADRAVRERVGKSESELRRLGGKLESLSPLAVLARGYSVTQAADSDALLTSARNLAAGQSIKTTFAEGWALSRIERTGEARSDQPSHDRDPTPGKED